MRQKGLTKLVLMEFIAAWLGAVVMILLELAFLGSFATLWFLCMPMIPLASILMLGIMRDGLLGNPKKRGTGWVFCAVSFIAIEISAGISWPFMRLKYSGNVPELWLVFIWILYFAILVFAVVMAFRIVRHNWNQQQFQLCGKESVKLAVFTCAGGLVAAIGMGLYYRGLVNRGILWLIYTLAITIAVVACAQCLEHSNFKEKK